MPFLPLPAGLLAPLLLMLSPFAVMLAQDWTAGTGAGPARHGLPCQPRPM